MEQVCIGREAAPPWLEGGEQQRERDAKIRKKGVRVFLTELKLCGSKRNLARGKDIHAKARASGNDACIFVATALINMYAKCGSMADAREVFEGIAKPDAVSWTALILGYAEYGEGSTALDLFQRMKSQGCAPDTFTFVAALKACASIALKEDGSSGRAECLKQGRRIHSEVRCNLNVHVQSALIDMYGKCGCMYEARRVFDAMKERNVVSWTALILGYAENGEGLTALDLFARMKSEGLQPNSFTLVAALKSCTCLALEQEGSAMAAWLEQGRRLHSEAGGRLNIYVQNTLIDMYSKCRSIREARQVFECIENPTVVSWNALILGYAENGDGVAAMDLFARMRARDFVPNYVTFRAVLKACSLLGALEFGRKIHAEIEDGNVMNAVLVTCLVDFYAKCGSLVEAQQVFDSHPRTRDLVTWNALLAGHSRLGDETGAFRVFERLQDAGFKPDAVTFLCILSSCSHAGLVAKAQDLFEAMWTTYGISPCIEHYNCMLDILGRSNKLDDAMALLESMPCRANVVTWLTLLAACCKWKNVEKGRLAFKWLLKLDETNPSAYVLMAHLCGSRGMLEEQERVLGMKSKLEAWKEAERSCWMSELGQLHTFVQ